MSTRALNDLKKLNGYLVEVVTTTTQLRLGAIDVVSKTNKIPVEDVYDATVEFAARMHSAELFREAQNTLMKDWLSMMYSGSADDPLPPNVRHNKLAGSYQRLFEYWYEPWTAEQREAYEKAVGLQKEAIEENRDGSYVKVTKTCEECYLTT